MRQVLLGKTIPTNNEKKTNTNDNYSWAVLGTRRRDWNSPGTKVLLERFMAHQQYDYEANSYLSI